MRDRSLERTSSQSLHTADKEMDGAKSSRCTEHSPRPMSPMPSAWSQLHSPRRKLLSYTGDSTHFWECSSESATSQSEGGSSPTHRPRLSGGSELAGTMQRRILRETMKALGEPREAPQNFVLDLRTATNPDASQLPQWPRKITNSNARPAPELRALQLSSATHPAQPQITMSLSSALPHAPVRVERAERKYEQLLASAMRQTKAHEAPDVNTSSSWHSDEEHDRTGGMSIVHSTSASLSEPAHQPFPHVSAKKSRLVAEVERISRRLERLSQPRMAPAQTILCPETDFLPPPPIGAPPMH